MSAQLWPRMTDRDESRPIAIAQSSDAESVGEHLKEVVSDTERLFKARVRLFQAQVEASGPELKQTVALAAVANIVLTAGAVVLMIALARGAEVSFQVSYPLVLFTLGLAALGVGLFFLKSIGRKVEEIKNLFRFPIDSEAEGLK